MNQLRLVAKLPPRSQCRECRLDLLVSLVVSSVLCEAPSTGSLRSCRLRVQYLMSRTLEPFTDSLWSARSPPTSKRVKTSVSTSSSAQPLGQQQQVPAFEGVPMPPAQVSPSNPRKRRASPQSGSTIAMAAPAATAGGGEAGNNPTSTATAPEPTGKKKGRTNIPWTAEEEQRLKAMRDAGSSWCEIAKVCFANITLQSPFT